jgi:hypothetical protein
MINSKNICDYCMIMINFVFATKRKKRNNNYHRYKYQFFKKSSWLHLAVQIKLKNTAETISFEGETICIKYTEIGTHRYPQNQRT